MQRALSVSDLLNKKYDLFPFQGAWEEAFDKPERSGVWFIWGNSGNGKTSFVLQLMKYLAQFERIAFDSMEEAAAETMQRGFKRFNMQEAAGRIIILPRERMDELDERLSRRKAPKIAVIDSVQYSDMNWKRYKYLKEKHDNKLLIFISHAEGRQPDGKIARKIMYDATLKIWVEGYRAFSKGRYIGETGRFTIWPEGAARYWGDED